MILEKTQFLDCDTESINKIEKIDTLNYIATGNFYFLHMLQ